MASQLPHGEPAPADGSLPADALTRAVDQPLGLYVHVPFCASRCGYCDFNTYTVGELGAGSPIETYLAAVRTEMALAARVLGTQRQVSTVFFGGGTPTMLPVDELGRLLSEIRDRFPMASDVEVTTEANPESVDQRYLDTLRSAGFNRISFGMQSVKPHILAILERTHAPSRPVECVTAARTAGFDHVSLDLIYGTPGESDDDWAASLAAAVDSGVDHVSCYALVVEDGTAMARKVAQGQLPAPDDDVLADRYLLADATLTAAGFDWYEISNWARSPQARSRHNEGYWQSADWWGIGPGAHSHVGGVRWWNVKHPATYASRLAEGLSPAQAREILTASQRYEERVLLQVRLRDGVDLTSLDVDAVSAANQMADEGLLSAPQLAEGRVVLTLTGRLLADHVVRTLLG